MSREKKKRGRVGEGREGGGGKEREGVCRRKGRKRVMKRKKKHREEKMYRYGTVGTEAKGRWVREGEGR